MHVDRCDTRMFHHLYAFGLWQKASVQALTARYLCKPDEGLTLNASRGDSGENETDRTHAQGLMINSRTIS